MHRSIPTVRLFSCTKCHWSCTHWTVQLIILIWEEHLRLVIYRIHLNTLGATSVREPPDTPTSSFRRTRFHLVDKDMRSFNIRCRHYVPKSVRWHPESESLVRTDPFLIVLDMYVRFKIISSRDNSGLFRGGEKGTVQVLCLSPTMRSTVLKLYLPSEWAPQALLTHPSPRHFGVF